MSFVSVFLLINWKLFTAASTIVETIILTQPISVRNSNESAPTLVEYARHAYHLSLKKDWIEFAIVSHDLKLRQI